MIDSQHKLSDPARSCHPSALSLSHQGRGHNLHRTYTLSLLVSCSLSDSSFIILPVDSLSSSYTGLLTLRSPNMAIILLLLGPLNLLFLLPGTLFSQISIQHLTTFAFIQIPPSLKLQPLNIPLPRSLLYAFSTQECLMLYTI